MFLSEVKSAPNEDISLLIRKDNHSHNYICECGDASKLTVKECQDTRAIFLSHTHIDHFINFDFILRHQIGIGKRVIICGPEGITRQVQSKVLGYQWNLITPDSLTYEIREITQEGKIKRSEINPPTWEIIDLGMREDEVIYENDAFAVMFTILDHKTDSIAYLFKERNTIKINLAGSSFRGGPWIKALKQAFEEGNAAAEIVVGDDRYEAQALFHLLEVKQGDSVGVIMDHAANEENHQKIKALFQGCKQVFIESFYKEVDKEFAELNFHSYSIQSARIMKACKVEKAIPVHFSRKYNSEEVEELIAEFYGELEK